MPKGTGWSYDKVYEEPRQYLSIDDLVRIQEEYEKPMVEAVAKEIFRLDVEDNDGYGEYTKEDVWDKVAGQDQNHYRRMSRAAIQAMRIYQRKQEEGK
jgi:hypothetical protein